MQCLYWILLCAIFTITSCGGGSGGSSGVTTNNVSSLNNSSSVASSQLSSAESSSQASLIVADAFYGNSTRLVGRFDKRIPKRVSFTWPGSALEYSFSGTSTSIGIDDVGQNRFQITIDDASYDLYPHAGNFKYTLASRLTQSTHHVKITRVSESFAGVSSFTSDPETDGVLLPAPNPAPHRLMVLGDSISVGFGIEGLNEQCSFAINTSNQQFTYSALAAKELNADLHTLAWSGIGVYRNYDEITPAALHLPDRQKFTLANDPSSLWDTSLYIPDAIIINVGTNDYSHGDPNPEYRNTMVDLISQLQISYPSAMVYVVVSPMLLDDLRTSQKNALSALTNNKVKLIEWAVNYGGDGFGCLYHPNKVTNMQFAKVLADTLKEDLQW
jgi:hypothetical protein